MGHCQTTPGALVTKLKLRNQDKPAEPPAAFRPTVLLEALARLEVVATDPAGGVQKKG
jgi:hypothetical protein